jgi:hypothetical protein
LVYKWNIIPSFFLVAYDTLFYQFQFFIVSKNFHYYRRSHINNRFDDIFQVGVFPLWQHPNEKRIGIGTQCKTVAYFLQQSLMAN